MKNCKQCEIELKTKGTTFCSRSCAATFNNKLFKKRERQGSCKECGVVVHSSRTYCEKCFKEGKWRIGLTRNKTTSKPITKTRSESVISWRQRTKLKAIEYKGGGCIKCDYNKCVYALQFHHFNPAEKDFSISGVTKSWDIIKRELDKCVLLCSNCHFEQHESDRKNSLNS